MRLVPSDQIYQLYSDSDLPPGGWIQSCFTCNIQTAQTSVVDENIYKLICNRTGKKLRSENCKMFLCFQCKQEIRDDKISNGDLYKFCDKFIKNTY